MAEPRDATSSWSYEGRLAVGASCKAHWCDPQLPVCAPGQRLRWGASDAARTGAQPTGRTCASCSRMRKHVAQVMRQPTMSIRTCAAAAARIESRSVPLHARQPTCYPRTRPCEDDTEGRFRGALMQGPSAGQLGMHAQRARAEAGHRGLRRAWIDVPALAGSTPILARTKGSPVPASTDLARAGPPSAAARR